MSFVRFFLVRLAWAAFGLWLAVSLAYSVSFLPKPPPERIICGGERARTSCLPESHDFDTRHSLQERYRHFFLLLATDGSPGVSPKSGGDTGRAARAALPVTASVVAVALLLALAAAVLLARIRDRFASLPGYLAGGSFAVFLLGLWGLYLFGFKLGWAPRAGYCDFVGSDASCGGARDWLAHVILPSAALALFPAAMYARIVRAAHSRIRDSDEKERAFRRLALPVVRLAGRDFGFLVGAAILVEATFSLPGLGHMLTLGVTDYDRVAVQAALVYAAFVGIGVHFIVDVIVGALDPDLRTQWPVAGMPKPA